MVLCEGTDVLQSQFSEREFWKLPPS